jgi:hypothetical protein
MLTFHSEFQTREARETETDRDREGEGEGRGEKYCLYSYFVSTTTVSEMYER